MEKERNGSLDILKLILILMVILLHYMNINIGNGLINSKNLLGLSTHFLESFCIIACNVFILITGYCSVNKNSIRISKVLNLIITTLFYGICIFTLYYYILSPEINVELIRKAITSILDRWFIIVYIILYLLIPYINYIINNISKKNYLILLSILMISFSLWPTFLTDTTMKDYGYGIVNFINIYLVGAYLKKYELDEMKKKFLIITGIISLGCTTILSFFAQRAWNYNSIFVILQSIAFFLLISNIKIKSNTFIQKISASTLAIYLIHENCLISKYIYQNIFKCSNFTGTWLYLINLIYTVLGIFIICFLIEYIRKFIFKHTIDKLINDKFNNLEIKI